MVLTLDMPSSQKRVTCLKVDAGMVVNSPVMPELSTNRKLVPQSGITSGLPVIRELEEICASCAPTQLLPGIASAYFLSSIANTWPSTVLSAVSAYWTRAFMPLKSVQGFMEPLGTKPMTVRSILEKLLL